MNRTLGPRSCNLIQPWQEPSRSVHSPGSAARGAKCERRVSCRTPSATKQGFIVGHAFLAKGMSPKQAIHDGDTVSVSPNSFHNTRLLGVDTPEVSFSLPDETTFPSIGG
jgi:hypothetical protein